MEWRPLVPELVVSDFEESLRFYTQMLGFEVKHRRDDPPFAYLEREGSQMMIEALRPDSWTLAELVRPFGRGVNIQIECSDVEALRNQIAAAGVGVYREIEEAWYEAGDESAGQRQFLLADPDGYLLRFCEVIGTRKRDD